jgi:hypothetical protein
VCGILDPLTEPTRRIAHLLQSLVAPRQIVENRLPLSSYNRFIFDAAATLETNLPSALILKLPLNHLLIVWTFRRHSTCGQHLLFKMHITWDAMPNIALETRLTSWQMMVKKYPKAYNRQVMANWLRIRALWRVFDFLWSLQNSKLLEIVLSSVINSPCAEGYNP